jgi:uncharacterized protein YbcI
VDQPQVVPTRAEYGSIASQISREIVRLHAKLYGRGPTKAKTFLADEYALCVLEEVFTPAEKTLIRAGNPAQVHATRAAFQDAVEPDFVELVIAATGRNVRAFVSQIHIETDTAVELFLFEPDDSVAWTPSVDGAGDGAGLDGDGAGPDGDGAG